MRIIINSSSMVPIYEQVADQIKTLIRDGELKAKDILPSVRVLSKELKISALTVKKAYDSLEVKADMCKSCHHCEKECPQHIKISQVMKDVVKIME